VRFITNLYLCFLIFPLFSMPHLHSAGAREARAARAATRGYLRRRRPGVRFLEVPAALHEKGKVMMKSLELHRAHSGVCGYSTQYARGATIGARSEIGEQAFAMSMKTHQEANTAKHNVDNDDGDDNVTVLLSPARPTAARLPCVGSSDGKLSSNLAAASAQEKVLLQKIVESQANLLLRVRQTERLIQATNDASKAIEARLGAAVEKMERVTLERCGDIVEKSLASVVPMILRSVTDIGQVFDHDLKALRNVVEELKMDKECAEDPYDALPFDPFDTLLDGMCGGQCGAVRRAGVWGGTARRAVRRPAGPAALLLPSATPPTARPHLLQHVGLFSLRQHWRRRGWE